MPQLNIRIDADLSARFHEMCAQRDTTATEVLRQAIAAFVERDMLAQRSRHILETEGPQAAYNERQSRPRAGVVMHRGAEPFRGTTALGEPIPERKPYQKAGKKP